MRKIKSKRRDLALIADELKAAQQREKDDIITIGGLLQEAKEAHDHGDWRPWLAANFGSSIRTAENYMAAARFVGKYATVAFLRPSALYLLGSKLDDGPEALFSPKAVKAILKAAESEWVNDKRAYDIARSMQPPPEEQEEREREDEAKRQEEQRAAEEAQKKEIDDILDGPPPELPQPPEPSQPKDMILPQFERAVEALAQVQTKLLASFADTTHSPDKITAVADFLKDVAKLIAKQKAA